MHYLFIYIYIVVYLKIPWRWRWLCYSYSLSNTKMAPSGKSTDSNAIIFVFWHLVDMPFHPAQSMCHLFVTNYEYIVHVTNATTCVCLCADAPPRPHLACQGISVAFVTWLDGCCLNNHDQPNTKTYCWYLLMMIVMMFCFIKPTLKIVLYFSLRLLVIITILLLVVPLFLLIVIVWVTTIFSHHCHPHPGNCTTWSLDCRLFQAKICCQPFGQPRRGVPRCFFHILGDHF